MALPKIDKPIYEVYLHSLKKNVKFRPFTVKEEKLLLMAGQDSEEKSLIDGIKQIINNCVVDGSIPDIEKLPMFDVEMLFIHLRARSIGEMATIRFHCNQVIIQEDGSVIPCNDISEIDYDVLQAKYVLDDTHKEIIKLNDNISMKMHYPNLKDVESMEDKDETDDEFIEFIASNVDSIIDGDQVYTADSVDKAEIVEFIGGLSRAQLFEITEFFATAPKVVGEVKYKCKTCGFNHEIELEGIQNFFD
jgi:hypothetical protein